MKPIGIAALLLVAGCAGMDVAPETPSSPHAVAVKRGPNVDFRNQQQWDDALCCSAVIEKPSGASSQR